MTDWEKVDYALMNLGGCWGKMDDTMKNRFGMTADRAMLDCYGPLEDAIRTLCKELGRPMPVEMMGRSNANDG